MEFAEMVRASPDPILVVDEQGRIVLVNPPAEAVFGYGPGELLGANVEMLVPERMRPVHSGQRRMFFDEPAERPINSGLELAGRRKDGSEFACEISILPLKGAGGRMAVCGVRDIGERKAAAARLQQIANSFSAPVPDQRGEVVSLDSARRDRAGAQDISSV